MKARRNDRLQLHAYQIQVAINRQSEILHDLVEHFTVLSGQAHDRFDLRIPLRCENQWCHFDGFRSCSKDA